MNVVAKKLPRGQVELNIELTVDEYQPFLAIAAKKISAELKIPGFRPGKADLATVKKTVGEAHLWEEALEGAVQKTFVKAVDEQKLITVGAPQIDVVKLAPGNPISYKALVSIMPEVELGEIPPKYFAKKEADIKTDDVKKIITDLQKSRSTEAKVNRAAALNDKIIINFHTYLDKIPVDNGRQDKFPLVIGEKTFIPGFEEELVGLSADQEKEFQLKFPENYHQKNLAGKFVDFKVKMLEVYELTPPALNDDFAKAIGFPTMAEAETAIKENLKTEADQKENQRLEDEIIEKIIDLSKFTDVPDNLIDSEVKKMIEELEHNLAHQGLKFEDYLVHLKKNKAELMLDFSPQAIKRIKSAVALRKIRENNKIEVSESEVDEEIKNTLAAYSGNPDVEKSVGQVAYRSYLKNVLAARKVIDYLKSVMVK
ncbi:MAG: trigger factor [Patescibacteria group bacterium]|nr:trigger factor [Patescibacteria group bacterium]